MCPDPDFTREWRIANIRLLYRRWGSFHRINIGRCWRQGVTFGWHTPGSTSKDAPA